MTYDFSGFDTLALTETEKEILKDLRCMADESGAEYGCALFETGEIEYFTSGEENRVAIPSNVMSRSVSLYHAHTNGTLLSVMDFQLLLRENVTKVVVISSDSMVQAAKIGTGYLPSEDEYKMISDELKLEIDMDIPFDDRYAGFTLEELQLQAIFEQSFRIPRYFKWIIEGGKL